MSDLTPKQTRFVREYLVDLNGTQAAIRAGYSPKTAEQIGWENLRKPQIVAAIAAAQHEEAKTASVTRERVLAEIAKLAFFDPAELVKTRLNGPEDIANLPENVRSVVAGWSWDRDGNFVLKLNNRQPALELAARHLGMLNDKLQIDPGTELSTALEAMRRRRK